MKPDFSLIETMRFDPGTGIIRRNLHSACAIRCIGGAMQCKLWPR